MKMYQSDNKSKRHAINQSLTAPRGTATHGHALPTTINSSKHQERERGGGGGEGVTGNILGLGARN
jgi:hypothetical protein